MSVNLKTKMQTFLEVHQSLIKVFLLLIISVYQALVVYNAMEANIKCRCFTSKFLLILLATLSFLCEQVGEDYIHQDAHLGIYNLIYTYLSTIW